MVILRHRNRQPFCPKRLVGTHRATRFLPFSLVSLSSSFLLLLPLHSNLSTLLFSLYTLLYPILFTMFAARQSLNLFQKRAFSASASQVRFLSSAHPQEKSYLQRAIQHANIYNYIGLQGRRSRCWWWHWPAPLSPLEAQPPCLRALPLRHPRCPWCRC